MLLPSIYGQRDKHVLPRIALELQLERTASSLGAWAGAHLWTPAGEVERTASNWEPERLERTFELQQAQEKHLPIVKNKRPPRNHTQAMDPCLQSVPQGLALAMSIITMKRRGPTPSKFLVESF